MLDLPFNHTVTIIIITVIVSMLAFSKQELMNRLIFWPPAMQRGQYDHFITHGFVLLFSNEAFCSILSRPIRARPTFRCRLVITLDFLSD